MENILTPIAVCAILFIGLPWIVLNYSLKVKRARGLSLEDEKLLDDLYETARRLEDRVVTIERIMTAENPRWRELAVPAEPASLPYDRRH